MKYISNAWYTVQITMHDGAVHELIDFNAPSLQMFHQKIWVQGFRLDINPGVTWEWIDPLRIHKVLIITQPQRYAID